MTSTPTQDRDKVEPAEASKSQPSYIKLAMRNMVRKRGTSIKHFLLSTIGLLAFLIGISYLTR